MQKRRKEKHIRPRRAQVLNPALLMAARLVQVQMMDG